MYECDSSTLEVLIIEVWLRLCILQVENIGMKKSRAGQQFNILCMAAEKDKFLNLVFRESTSIGVRILAISRASLRREAVLLQGEGFNYGPIPAKVCDFVVDVVNCTSRVGISKCSGSRSNSYCAVAIGNSCDRTRNSLKYTSSGSGGSGSNSSGGGSGSSSGSRSSSSGGSSSGGGSSGGSGGSSSGSGGSNSGGSSSGSSSSSSSCGGGSSLFKIFNKNS